MKYLTKDERASLGADIAACVRLVRTCARNSTQAGVTNDLNRAARFAENALELLLTVELRKEPVVNAKD